MTRFVLKFYMLAISMLLVSVGAFAQFDVGDPGGGFPPMGNMGPMGGNEQNSTQMRKSVGEGVDISQFSLIDDSQTEKLIEKFKKKIEKHNSKILSMFDLNKDGKLDKKELKNWKKWLQAENGKNNSNEFMPMNDNSKNMFLKDMPDSIRNVHHLSSSNGYMSMKGDANINKIDSNNDMHKNIPVVATAVRTIQSVGSLNANTVSSNGTNESVITVIKDGKFSADELTLKKEGGDTSSLNESNLCGVNAALRVCKDASAEFSGSSITTNANGANAVFAYGKNAKIRIDNVRIETLKSFSRGLDATFGGMIEAKDIIISTKESHSPALATGREGGMVSVINCNATTKGEFSPSIYSTGAIKASNSVFYASGSEAAVIEGKSLVTLDNCTLTGLKRCGVMLYQNHSGNASVGTSVLNMKNSKLNIGEGPIFYCTNTNAKIVLENNEFISHSGSLLQITGNEYCGGKEKSGANVLFISKDEVMEGDICVDDISSADITFDKGTYYTGCINAGKKSQSVNVNLVKGFKWVMTDDSNIETLTIVGMNLKEALKSIQMNGHKLNYIQVKTITLE